MKRYFFMGFGVGFIIAGIVFYTNQKIQTLQISSQNLENTTSKETKEKSSSFLDFDTTPSDISSDNLDNQSQEEADVSNDTNNEKLLSKNKPDIKSTVNEVDKNTAISDDVKTQPELDKSSQVANAVANTVDASDNNEKSLSTPDKDTKKEDSISATPPKEVYYYVQLRSSRHIETCRDLMDQIDDIEVKIIDTGDVYRLISIKEYSYSEALKVAAHLKEKYNITTYVKKF